MQASIEMRTSLLGLLLLSLLTSCEIELGEGCTEIGCSDQATLWLRPDDGRWSEGRYALTLEAGEQRFTCEELAFPADLPLNGTSEDVDCGGPGIQVRLQQDADCTETRSGDAITQSCKPLDGQYALIASIDGTPAAIDVHFTLDDRDLVDERIELDYETDRPNGPDCDPECKLAIVQRKW